MTHDSIPKCVKRSKQHLRLLTVFGLTAPLAVSICHATPRDAGVPCVPRTAATAVTATESTTRVAAAAAEPATDQRVLSKRLPMQHILPSTFAKMMLPHDLWSVTKVVPYDAEKVLYVEGHYTHLQTLIRMLDKPLTLPRELGVGGDTQPIIERIAAQNTSSVRLKSRILSKGLPTGIAAIAADPSLNSLWVYGTREAVERFKPTVRLLDATGEFIVTRKILPSVMAQALIEGGLPEGITKVVPYDTERVLYLEGIDDFLSLRRSIEELESRLNQQTTLPKNAVIERIAINTRPFLVFQRLQSKPLPVGIAGISEVPGKFLLVYGTKKAIEGLKPIIRLFDEPGERLLLTTVLPSVIAQALIEGGCRKV